MPSVCFDVPFVRGKARPKFGNGRAYTPKPTTEAQKTIVDAYREACFGDVLAAPAGVPVTVTITTTRSVLSGFRKRDGDSHADVQKPDADNVAKLVMDALNGVAYEDDSQVTCLVVLKMPRTRGASPLTKILVEWSQDGTSNH